MQNHILTRRKNKLILLKEEIIEITCPKKLDKNNCDLHNHYIFF